MQSSSVVPLYTSVVEGGHMDLLRMIDEDDQDWINFETCNEEDVGIDEEQLMKDGHWNSNSNFINTEEERERQHTDEGNEGREDVGSGPTKDIGPKTTKEIGLGEIGLKVVDGRGRDLSHGQKMRIKKKGPEETNDEGILPKTNLDLRVLGSKRRRKLEECYPESLAKSWAKKMQETNARANQGHKGRAESSTGSANKVNLVVSRSISNGCIANRNRELRREMILHEESIGASGGLLCFWNKKTFDKTGDHTGDGYLRISGELGIYKVKCNLVNVYGPNDRQKQLKLWDELRNMITKEGGPWLIAGDFNAVRCALHGTAMSRLDRVLMNAEMSRMGGDWVQQGLKRNISDHCAIVLKSRTTNWGPKPFRVLDAWLLHPDFKKIIEEKWKAMEVDGFAGYKCKQKLKGLKEFLKGWNQEVFGDMEAQYEQAVKQIEQRKINGLNDHSPPKKLRKHYEVVKAQKLRVQTAKVLANRLKSVLPGIISENQSTFWGGRQLVDGVLVLNEVVEEVKRKKQQAFVFKADFAKAYDCVNWSFLEWMMDRMGFGTKWRSWIMECLSSSRISVLINGSPTEEFKVEKGLRQVSWVEGSADMLRCGVGKSPFIYLGLPVDGNSGRKKLWEPLINKFRAKVAVWKAASLSFGGRLTLLNSRTFLWGGVESQKKISWVKWEYVCCSKIKGGLGVSDLRRKNWAILGKWWSRFGDGVESLWKRIVKEKYYGGKWEEVDISTIGNQRMSKIWRDIIKIEGRSMKLRNMLVEGFKWEVGEGNRVSFWSEPWVGNKTLRVLYPRLYEFSTNKECKISDMGVWEGDKWRWKMEWRRDRIGREKDEEEKLREGLERLQLKKRVEDGWRWTHDPKGRYGVKKAYDFLAPTECVLDEQWRKLIWCKLVPSKVSFFGWRLCLDRLPTQWNIRKRGVPLQEEELKCVLCKDKVEEVNHLFSMCKEVWIFWVEVLQWWGMVTVMPNNALSVANIFVNDLGRLIGKEMGACIFLVAAWYLWYWRNGEVFNNGNNIRGRLMEMVQAKSFFWIKNKIHGCVFSFHEWKASNELLQQISLGNAKWDF
ncbi:hypothetical protein SLEP1_g9574 [Rubroshorea leprosula]|uniref:Reverse transcriptase domain-containing protein n=1 Tax=Rubroshorea leprosula TaxID=152421 RepID=A0AAV5I9U8_9ROSI|nr:hypothetical protein SLEP1_g9574 [Rubroshorea leprosula]